MSEDFYSEDNRRVARYESFCIELRNRGFFIFITFHHIIELINLAIKVEKLKRIAFLRRLPFVAWLRGINGGAGSVADLLQLEIKYIVGSDGADIGKVRNYIRGKLIEYGTGKGAISDWEGHWDDMEAYVRASSDTDKEIVGISRSNFVDFSNTKLRDWISGRVRPERQTALILDKLEANLLRDLNARGDKRLKDKDKIAKNFLDSVRSEYRPFVSEATKPVIAYLRRLGLTPKDIADDNITLGEIGDLAVFRQQVDNLSKNFTTMERLKALSIRPSDVPSVIIKMNLRKYGQSQPEWKGSELNDRNMAAFAPYIDICCVDKRTHQDFISASRKVTPLRDMKINVLKYSKYYDVKL